MNQICVSLDLETTGLKPEYDQIIEIGAIKFCGEEILDSFHTLVNPYRSLSYHICWLTGITQEELETAPPLAAVAGDLISFVGSHLIVGQNTSFDMNFPSAKGIRFSNPTYDTTPPTGHSPIRCQHPRQPQLRSLFGPLIRCE